MVPVRPSPTLPQGTQTPRPPVSTSLDPHVGDSAGGGRAVLASSRGLDLPPSISTYGQDVIVVLVFSALLEDILHSEENVPQVIVIWKSRLGNFTCFQILQIRRCRLGEHDSGATPSWATDFALEGLVVSLVLW